ncbi:MAG: carbon storage regulator CsrA [Candidatus Cloacimonadales bacterium]|jgi:carbon storage regulator|nr:carbon storage regulator CsrA [Candidatus Cloacimonadota bacterium]MDD3501654.1 carbon storage regulator CsrA [Candidatus Cloacimonadota bacterium]MDX9977878.1 carbon storage regulator CsrA [Candidatus Cloacimonadales bacterium]
MLVLTRKQGESIRIGDDIEIVVTDINKGSARIGILAPKSMTIYRKEIYERILKENLAAAQLVQETSNLDNLNKILSQKLKKQ